MGKMSIDLFLDYKIDGVACSTGVAAEEVLPEMRRVLAEGAKDLVLRVSLAQGGDIFYQDSTPVELGIQLS